LFQNLAIILIFFRCFSKDFLCLLGRFFLLKFGNISSNLGCSSVSVLFVLELFLSQLFESSPFIFRLFILKILLLLQAVGFVLLSEETLALEPISLFLLLFSLVGFILEFALAFLFSGSQRVFLLLLQLLES